MINDVPAHEGELDEEKDEEEEDEAIRLLKDNRKRKKARIKLPTQYRCMKHLYSTTNVCERLFLAELRLL